MTFKGRSSAMGAHYFAVVFFLVMAGATISLLFMTPLAFALVIVLPGMATWGWMLSLTFQAMRTIRSTFTIDPSGIAISGPGGERMIPWRDLQSAQVTQKSTDSLRLTVQGQRPLTLPLFFVEDGRELSRIIRGVVGGESPSALLQAEAQSAIPAAVSAKPAPQLVNVATQAFRPKPFVWALPVLMIPFFASLIGFGVYMMTQGKDWTGILGGGFFVLFFGFMGLVGIAGLCQAFVSYAVDVSGVERKTPLGTKRLEWSAIDSAVRGGSEVKSFELTSGSEKMSVDTSLIAGGDVLLNVIATRLQAVRERTASQIAGRHFGMDPFLKWFTVFLFGTLGPAISGAAIYMMMGGMNRPGHPEDATPTIIMGILSLMTGALLIGLLPVAVLKRFTPHEHSLEVRGATGTRRVEFDKLTRVEIGSRRQPKSGTIIRTLRLEHSDGGVMIDSNIKDFGLLQDFILAHVNPAIIRDKS